MLSFLKNVLATAGLVCVTTVVSVAFGAVLALWVMTPQSQMPADPNMAAAAGIVGGLVSAVVGVFFCIVTLFLAALTMPPSLFLIRAFDLPRPAMDMIGGGVMGLVSAGIGVGIFDHDKFAGMITPEAAQILGAVGFAMGCLLGFTRFAVLVRSSPSPSRDFAVAVGPT